MSQSLRKDTYVASSADFLPRWAAESLRAKAVGMDLKGVREKACFEQESPRRASLALVSSRSSQSAKTSSAFTSGTKYHVPWWKEPVLPTSLANPLPVETVSYHDLEEDEESHAVQAAEDPTINCNIPEWERERQRQIATAQGHREGKAAAPMLWMPEVAFAEQRGAAQGCEELFSISTEITSPAAIANARFSQQKNGTQICYL